MKKTLLLAFSLFFLFAVRPACAQETADPLLERAVSLAALLDELAENESYVSFFSASETLADTIAAWGAGDPAKLRALYKGEWSAPFAAMQSLLDAPMPALSDALLVQANQRAAAALPSLMNGAQGAEILAAASIATVQTAFPCDSLQQPVLYLLLPEDGTPIAVTFYPAEDGAVAALATYLAVPALREADSPAAVHEALAAYGALLTLSPLI